MMRPFCLLSLGLLLAPAAAFPGRASAHAMLDHAEPRVGSDVNPAPAQVRLWFTENLEPAFSSIKVLDADGREVDRLDSHLDPGDKKEMVVDLNPLPAGTYTVAWRAVSVDTHRTQGDFKFTVKS